MLLPTHSRAITLAGRRCTSLKMDCIFDETGTDSPLPPRFGSEIKNRVYRRSASISGYAAPTHHPTAVHDKTVRISHCNRPERKPSTPARVPASHNEPTRFQFAGVVIWFARVPPSPQALLVAGISARGSEKSFELRELLRRLSFFSCGNVIESCNGPLAADEIECDRLVASAPYENPSRAMPILAAGCRGRPSELPLLADSSFVSSGEYRSSPLRMRVPRV
jgi:hypothetical protein